MKSPKYEIFKSEKNGEFYFRLRAKNGEPILKSEGYVNKEGCLNGIDSVRENAPSDSSYNRLTAKNGEFYFNLVARNGEIIGTSETYRSKQGLEKGIASVKANAPEAILVDLTESDAECPKDEKSFNIVVNGRQKTVCERILSFIDIVKLAFGNFIPNEQTVYTMTFKKAADKEEGVLVLGDEIRIKSGVIFNVTATDKS